MEEKFYFFLKERPFTQWARSLFVVDGVQYTHAEQYMMAEKARLFKDEEMLKKIMKAEHPKEQKELGRQVRGFDKKKWEAVAKDVVFRGNMAKFSQNEDMREKLFSTAGTTLVEVNPEDPIWGIGLSVTDPRCLSRETWRGKNWLGEILTKVREELLKERQDGLRRRK